MTEEPKFKYYIKLKDNLDINKNVIKSILFEIKLK